MAEASVQCDGTEVKKNRGLPKRRECPVCFVTLISPVFQCFSGHLICQPCLRKLTQCPVCREAYPERQIRAREFEEIMKECVVQCRFSKFGCEALLHHDEILQHESNCEFKRIKCPGGGPEGDCDCLIPEQNLIEHFNKVHKATGISNYCLGQVVEIRHNCVIPVQTGFSVMISPHFLMTDEKTEPFFILTNVTQDGQLVQWAITGDFDGRCEAVMKLQFFAKGEPTINTKWSGPISANRGFTFVSQNGNFLTAPVQQLKYYGDGWRLFIKILKKEVEVEDESKTEKIKWENNFDSPPLQLTSTVQQEPRVSDFDEKHLQFSGITHDAYCDGCNCDPIIGIRYKCNVCDNFDLCESCFRSSSVFQGGLHANHFFSKILQSNIMPGDGNGSFQNNFSGSAHNPKDKEWTCRHCHAMNDEYYGDFRNRSCVQCGQLRVLQ